MCKKKPLKARLDVILVERGIAESREQARRLILARAVEIPGQSNPKPGQQMASDIEIIVREKVKYVSRGGLKLEAALAHFKIDISGKVCVDVGASTGGFTDCMLQHGAAQVYAVDVGASQMHERVRHDERVALLEHTNARNLSPEQFDPPPQFCAVDVSFISLGRVTGPLRSVVAPGSHAVFLIKPQFEAGREAVSRGKGVIRDPAVHKTVLVQVLDELAGQGWQVQGLTGSPIAGGSGNIEFLCYAIAGDQAAPGVPVHIDIDEVIQSARPTLK